MANIYQVAERAGVSLATVSRVINGKAKVAERTKLRVEQAMSELGYRPNSIAQSLASATSNRVGILVSVLDGPFFSNMLASIETTLRDAGKHVIITAGHSDEVKEKEAIEFLISCRCDALILCIDSISDDYLVDLSKRNVQFAVINHQIPQIADRCFIVDNEQGGYLATKSAIEKGHKQIGYISGPTYKEDARLRLRGHQRALQEAGIKFDPDYVYCGDYHDSSGEAGFAYLHSLEKACTAIVCGNDDMATGVIFAARRAGIDLPQQLSVIGFDDLIFARYTYPSLTSIENPISDMGTMAAYWILQTVYKQRVGKVIENMFEAKMVVRDSLSEPIYHQSV